MTDLIPAARGRPGGQAVHVSYETRGHLIRERPIPWTAESIVVEVLLRLPIAARSKTDFSLVSPGMPAVAPDSLRKDEHDPNRYRLVFRLPPTTASRAELLWRRHLLSEIAIPHLRADEFFHQLRIANPTTTIRVGDKRIAASTYVGAQCRDVTVSVVLRSPTVLAPLAEVGLRVVFRSDRTAAEVSVEVPLSGSQLTAREALVSVSPPKPLKRAGSYSATWYAGDRELHTHRLLAVTGSRFVQSLRVSDTRFLLGDKLGGVRTSRHAPPLGSDLHRLGPCFLVTSSLPGVAGLVNLRVQTQHQPPTSSPAILDQAVLVTDGPTVFAPGLIDVAELRGLSGFELRHRTRVLGVLSMHPVPTATFNAEGGFKPPPEFVWTPTAEDELAERLSRLMKDEPPE